MKKYSFLILFSTIFFFCIPIKIFASYDGIITRNAVNIREDYTTSSKVLYTLNSNTSIVVVDKKLYGGGSDCQEGWLEVIYKNSNGYVCSKYVSIIDTTFDGINVMDYTARVTGNNVSVRKSASTSSTQLATLSLGTNVEILSTTSSTSSGCTSKTWYMVQYYGNKTGYICKDYVVKKEEITANDDEYTQVLKEKGFPNSYIPYLTHLHNKYPNWNFEAIDTNLEFSTVIDKEEGKNLMQTANDSYRTSDVPSEGSTWFKVNSGVIAFYMDPRNWLTENRIFMFENLKYINEKEDIYPSLIKNIFGSGKLSDDKYTVPMFNSGKNLGMSPLAIATRIRLEVGANGSASTSGESFTWDGKTYSGYYNFFNIGAYEAKINGVSVSAVKRGLLYAAKLAGVRSSGELWNNIETAITEGSSTLAKNYINKGQDTLYYQKFNVSPDSATSHFTHQYMTNIQAPAIEGSQTYNAYKSADILNSNITFEIPIYNLMPEYTSLPATGNTNNDLSNLQIDGYSISPLFDSDILTYEVYVPTSVEKINIKATAKSELSTVSGDGEITLESDESIVTIKVVSQAGTEKKYTIAIHKVDDTTKVEDVTSKSSLVINSAYLTKIKNSTTVQSLKDTLIKNGAKSVVITDKNGNESSPTSYVGTNYKITITTTIESKSYTISVNGDTSGDGQVTILDLLQIQKHIKKVTTLNNATLLSADTSGDGQVTILDLLQVQKHIKKINYL